MVHICQPAWGMSATACISTHSSSTSFVTPLFPKYLIMSQKYLFSPNLTRSSRFLGFRESCRSSAGGRRRTGGVSRRVASGCPSEGGGGSGSVAGRGRRAWREWRRSRPGTARFAGCACGLQFSVSGGWRGGFPWAASRCPQQGGVGFPGGLRVGVRRKEAEASRRAACGRSARS